MGRRVTAYTAREVLAPTLSAVGVTTFLLLTTQILRIGEAAFGYGLRAVDFLGILGLLVPRFLVFTLPIAVLVGVVGGLGRLSDEREVLAFEAAGLSPAALWPGPLVLGALATAATLSLTLWGEPRALAALSERLAAVVERNLAAGLVPGVIHEEIPGVVLHARGRAADGTLQDVFLRMQQAGGEATVVAREAVLEPTGRGGLVLRVRDGEVLQPGETADDGRPVLTRARFEAGAVALDVGNTVRRRVRFIGDLDVLGQAELGALAARTEDPAARRKMEITWHRRFSVPAACLAFALLGMPLGLAGGARRKRRGAGFVIGLGAVIAYYVLVRLAEAAAHAGTLPPGPALWLPNALTAGLGAALLWRRSAR